MSTLNVLINIKKKCVTISLKLSESWALGEEWTPFRLAFLINFFKHLHRSHVCNGWSLI